VAETLRQIGIGDEQIAEHGRIRFAFRKQRFSGFPR
jgi:hypothetical protein